MAEKLYRVWDIENQKYYSTGKKSIWKSETWAVNAVKDMWGNFSAEDFEIHEIEQVVTRKTNALTLVETKKDIEKKKQMARNENSVIVRKVKNLTGIEFHVAQMLYAQKRLIDSEMEKLRPYMERIKELNEIMK